MFTVGWVLMLLVNLSAVVLGAALLIPPLDPGAEGFMGKSLTELRAFSPSVADWVWHENKMSIFSLLLLGSWAPPSPGMPSGGVRDGPGIH
jgi:hypothetical protein